MEQFDLPNQEIKNKIPIYIISVSYRPFDKELAASNKYISCFEKPLTGEIIKSRINLNQK